MKVHHSRASPFGNWEDVSAMPSTDVPPPVDGMALEFPLFTHHSPSSSSAAVTMHLQSLSANSSSSMSWIAAGAGAFRSMTRCNDGQERESGECGDAAYGLCRGRGGGEARELDSQREQYGQLQRQRQRQRQRQLQLSICRRAARLIGDRACKRCDA